MNEPLTEEEAIEAAIQESEELFNNQQPQDVTTGSSCLYCNSVSTDERLLKDFGISVCYNCKKGRKEEYRCISKSRACKEYLLNDHQITKLKHAIVYNPKKIGWKDMKLYLLSQVKNEATRIWGSMEEIEEEKRRRLAAKQTRGMKKKANKKSLFDPISTTASSSSSNILEKEVKRQRIQASLQKQDDKNRTVGKVNTLAPLPDVFVKRHTIHTFGVPTPTGNEDEFMKVCLECGLKNVYQSFSI